jgi:hypothetical protein
MTINLKDAGRRIIVVGFIFALIGGSIVAINIVTELVDYPFHAIYNEYLTYEFSLAFSYLFYALAWWLLTRSETLMESHEIWVRRGLFALSAQATIALCGLIGLLLEQYSLPNFGGWPASGQILEAVGTFAVAIGFFAFGFGCRGAADSDEENADTQEPLAVADEPGDA